MLTEKDVENKRDELKDTMEQLKGAKKGIVIQAITFMILFTLIGFLFGYTVGINSLGDYQDVSLECRSSLECEKDCIAFYPSNDINHSLECSYKCLTAKYCD